MQQQPVGATARELEGKVALVTGAGSGIGYAVAERLAAAGAGVLVNYLGFADEAIALAERLSRAGPRAIAVMGDVSKSDDVQAMVSRAVSELGGLDIVINNAGVERPFALLDLPEAEWDREIAINLKACFLCLQAGARAMRDAGHGGSIVNISSVHEDRPFPTYSAYCAAKGGLRMLMRNAALELGPLAIRVNNVAPGAIATPINAATLNDPARLQALNSIIPLQRLGLPADVAEVVLFLASNRSAYVTGSTYYVDGGMVRFAPAL